MRRKVVGLGFYSNNNKRIREEDGQEGGRGRRWPGRRKRKG